MRRNTALPYLNASVPAGGEQAHARSPEYTLTLHKRRRIFTRSPRPCLPPCIPSDARRNRMNHYARLLALVQDGCMNLPTLAFRAARPPPAPRSALHLRARTSPRWIAAVVTDGMHRDDGKSRMRDEYHGYGIDRRYCREHDALSLRKIGEFGILPRIAAVLKQPPASSQARTSWTCPVSVDGLALGFQSAFWVHKELSTAPPPARGRMPEAETDRQISIGLSGRRRACSHGHDRPRADSCIPAQRQNECEAFEWNRLAPGRRINAPRR